MEGAGFSSEVKRLEQVIEEIKRGINDYLNGDYDNLRKSRPNKCEHDRNYYDACENCIDKHFTNLLSIINAGRGKMLSSSSR